MSKQIANLKTKIYWSKIGFFISYALLIALISAWNLLRQGGPLWSVWALQALPLLIFLPALIKQYYRSFSWFCFLILLYFVVAVESNFKSNANIFDQAFLLLTVLLFLFSMMSSRWLQYSLYQRKNQPVNKENIA